MKYNSSMLKYLISLLGIILSVPLLALTTLALILSISASGIGYLAAGFLIAAGMIFTPWRSKYPTYLVATGLLTLLIIAGLRIAPWKQETDITMVTLPGGRETRRLSYLFDEQDGVIFGEALFHLAGGTSAREHENISQALKEDYSQMKHKQRVVPSPVLNTYLNLQSPNAFDAIVIEPGVNHHADTGVIFLHGFMGNVTAQCWEIAQAVGQFGAVTVCPSTGWQGKWWEQQGEEILRSTFRYLKDRGVQKIYLGGFSNGGAGVSRLISKLGNETGLRGLIFIDGISNAENIKEADLPVLILQGTQDERMPASESRRTADLIGDMATYVEINGDHFLIMKQPRPVQNALLAWLEKQAK